MEPYLGTELVIDQVRHAAVPALPLRSSLLRSHHATPPRPQHGDKTNYRFVNGVQRQRHKKLTKMASRSAMSPFNTIYVCQSNPDLWDPKPKELLGNVRRRCCYRLC